MELVKLFPLHRYSVNIFSYSGPSGILVLTESRIPLKLVLEGIRIDALSIRLVLMNGLNLTESAVF